jgi:predicted 3-demethylubiquinone-9 3-methyltransferase (glyoxalase superfamily)
MQKITPFLWFDGNAEEAISFYTSIFKDAKPGNLHRLPDGQIITGSFQLHGQDFMVLNGGPMFKFTPAISFFVNCETQEEVDELWNKLLAGGGVEERCGWLKDKFGLSWQIIPSALGKLMGDKDPQKGKRVMDAMLTMKKINIQQLQDAYDAG